MFSCLQILEAFLWFVLITLLNVTLIILTLSVSRLLNLLVRLVAFLLFLNRQCLASISRWITEIGRAVQQECRDRSRVRSSACTKKQRDDGQAGVGRCVAVRAVRRLAGG